MHIGRHEYLAHRLSNLDELRRACRWMRFQLPPFGPRVCAVVVIDITEQQAAVGPVHNQSDVDADAY